MDDSISRQTAIETVSNLASSMSVCSNINESHGMKRMQENAVAVLRGLQPAEPERKKGKWIIQDNPGTGWFRVTCSECGEDVTSEIPVIGFFPNCKALWDYCPYCGSYNGGEQE